MIIYFNADMIKVKYFVTNFIFAKRVFPTWYILYEIRSKTTIHLKFIEKLFQIC